MKKLLVAAGFAGAFAIGSMAGGIVLPNVSASETNTSSNLSVENPMMNFNQGSGMMSMMAGSNGMMGDMSAMMGSMPIMEDVMVSLFNETAKTLKLTTDLLQDEINSGKTLEMIANEQGITPEKLVKEMEKSIQKSLDDLEKNGTVVTEQQKDMFLTMSTNMLTMNGAFACHQSN